MNFKLFILGAVITGLALILIFPQSLGNWAPPLESYLEPIAKAKIYNIEAPVIILLIGLILLFVGLKK